MCGDCVGHCRDNFWMLAHAEIIIGTPDNDIALTIRAMMACVWMLACKPFQINKTSISALAFQPVQLALVLLAIVQIKNLQVLKPIPAWRDKKLLNNL